jgi:Tol biopolymer transport system component
MTFRLAAILVAVLGVAQAQAQVPAASSKPKWDVNAPPGAVVRQAKIDVDEGSWMDLDVSPDGKTIAFDLLGDIYTMPIAGGTPTRIAEGLAYEVQPRFSPDGKRIAFSGANDHGGTDLYTRRRDGSATRLVIQDAGEPAWSRRDRLAYVRSGNVYTAHPSGRPRRWVTSGVSPDWSPDGSRLALVRPSPNLTFDGPTGRMYTVAPSGHDLRRVGRRTDVSHPVWSPDGRWLAYDGFDLGVYVRRLGSGAPPREVAPTQVSGESGAIVSFSPAWRPR